jgi:hypothetical protein
MPKGKDTRYHGSRRVHKDRFVGDLEDGAPGDVADYFSQQKKNTNYNLGLPDDYEGSY